MTAAPRATPADSANDPERSFGLVAVLVAVAGLSTGTTLIKSTGLSGSVAGFWRLLFGAAAWHLLILVRGRRFTRAALRATMVPGLLFGTNLAFFFTGVTKTAIAHAEFMGVLTPLLIVPLAAYRLRERVKPAIMLLGGLAIAGVLTIIAFSARKGGKASLKGDLLVLCGVFLWAAYLTFAKKVRAHMDTDSFMAGMTLWAFVAVTPFAVAAGRLGHVSAKAWILLCVMAFVSGMLGHGLLSYAQRHVPLGVITLLQLGQPPLGVLWGRIFLHETVRPLQIVGMVMVLGAVAGVARVQSRA